MPPLTLDTPLQFLKGVGPRKAEGLAEKNLSTVEDLLFHLPFRYEDRSRFAGIASLRPGDRATVRGRVLSSRLFRTRKRGFTILEAVVDDGTGGLGLVWYNQPYLRETIAAGREVILHGVAGRSRYRGRALQMENPQYEVVASDGTEAIHTGRVVPIHQRVGEVSTRLMRVLLHRILAELPASLPDPLPDELTRARGLIPRGEALRQVHFPPEDADLEACQARRTPAHRRLIYEEFLLLQLALGMRRRAVSRERRPPCEATPPMRERLQEVLPYRLTGAQRRVLKEIVQDMTAPHPMNRLLQGDVGSGKTIVALMAMLLAVENGRQAVLMAPTEILAEQHHRGVAALLARSRYRVQLLTGAMTAAERRPLLRALEQGYAHIVIGTHALIQQSVSFQNLGLAVIDEQHRFGVAQRLALRGKGPSGASPDVLVMTATPIPRSLALTVYGDLDLSVIDELPPGRRPIATHLRPETSRARIYEFIRREAAAGRQAYIVLPLVEESEKSDLRAAVELAADLSGKVFRDLRVGLVHGRMKPPERDDVMRRFAAGEIDVLVATTVIEVGIDVPNATVMVVEHAGRFGLSQLHQLRGRVGRGPHPSHCILVHDDDPTEEASRRLEVMRDHADGFAIAEKDLEIRGPGEFLGTRQSGLPEIRIGNIIRDAAVLDEARADAAALLSEAAAGPGHRPLLEHMKRQWGDRIGLMDVG
ncbi:MAG TPA: ATP-dependent DNA helicase RecG [Candidatus Polarisedimenticolia bacterium]|nr:ATP-dependent DNA helicase RecG [Candidatus Polarisedimenticolia bacterium]